MKNFYCKKSLNLALASMIIFCLTLSSFAQNRSQQNELYREQASEIVPGARYVLEGLEAEYPASVKFEQNVEISATQIIPWLKKTFEMPAEIDFQLMKSESEELGFVHQKYNQTYKGIRVDRAEYIIQTKNELVTSFRGDAYIIGTVNTTPSLTEAQALDIVLNHFKDSKFLWESDFWENEIKVDQNDKNASYYPKGELIITKFGEAQFKEVKNEFRLAYKFDIYTEGVEERVFIDAQNGEILYTLPLASDCEPAVTFTSIFNGTRSVKTEKYTSTDYRLNDNCLAAEIWVRDWGSTTSTMSPTEIENTTNTWTTQDEIFGATVLWEINESYNYFKTIHSRDAYDNANGDLKAYINAVFSGTSGDYTDNASMSFTNRRMKVGLGSSGTLANSWSSVDIIAHEYTHAVTASSANLVYSKEPGALNESFSDIFGEMVENYVVGPNDWLIGEDRTSGAIRSMSNPKAHSHPDTYLGTNWVTTSGDHYGVHTNSGVQNFWFFLLTDGGTGTNDNGDDYDVTGIGASAARTIAYRNLAVKLGQNSQHADARAGSIEAAEELYGTCSNAVKQVTNAWYAVGVGEPYVEAEVTSYYDVTCNGEADGSINISVVGTAPFTYSWSDGPTSKNRAGLSGGTYTLTVTDATGCADVVTQNIYEPPPLTVSGFETSNYNGYNISCNGGSDGWATANVSGGSPTYFYFWDVNAGEQETATATGLTAGTYCVMVMDKFGCSITDCITLTEPTPLTAAISNESNYNGYNISCNGGSDGWATAEGSGGVTPYTYLWSDGQTTATASNLTAGYYSVVITDANGCEASASITLTEPPPLTIYAGENQTVYYGYPPAECTTISWSGEGGGVPPYTITWDDGGEQEHEVCPGEFTTIYTVTITDLNGCVESDEVKICVIDVRCGKKLDKVELCHIPDDDPLNPVTICISVNAVAQHLALHGDILSFCGNDHSCEDDIRAMHAYTDKDQDYETKLTVYPNPFNESTTIEFSSGIEGEITIQLMDYTGRFINSLYSGRVEMGSEYKIKVSASDLAPGLNFCILRHSDGSVIIKKLILNR